MEKSANKRWKESGSTLSFKDWIDRENKKSEPSMENFIPFDAIKPDTSGIKETIDRAKRDLELSSGKVEKSDKSTILGLNKGVVIFSGILIVGSLGFYFYKRFKKNG